MTAIAMLALFVFGPIAMFLIWFWALSKTWLLSWLAIGGLICGAFLIAGLNAPATDWGFTLTAAIAWTVLWAFGGLIQWLRRTHRSEKM